MTREQQAGNTPPPQSLRWCVGKFVYQRGVKTPMHFMPLQSFQIDEALDFSHLFYLRALRLQPPEHAAVDEVLQKWMDGTAVKPIADAIYGLWEKAQVRGVVEFYPGIGLTFEYLKLLHKEKSGAEAAAPLSYAAVGPAAFKHRIMALHEDDGFRSYESDGSFVQGGMRLDGALSIYNHNLSIKLDAEPAIDLPAFLALSGGGPAVVALRVTTAENEEKRTTVKGRHLVLPSQKGALRECLASGGTWFSRFIPRFDEDFFIPDECARTGLLLACRSRPKAASLEGFSPVG